MRRLIRTVLAMLTAAILLQGASLVPASAATLVPFHGQFSATQTLYADGTGVLTGTGTASQMGRTSLSGNLSIIGPAPCAGGFLVHHLFTYTGANGDSIFVTIDNSTCPAGPGTLVGSGTYTVTGGTGRFTGASGSGTVSGVADVSTNPGPVSWTMDGTISSPGGI